MPTSHVDAITLALAGDVPDAVRAAKAHRPRVLVLDLGMAGDSTPRAIPAILAASPTTAIVVLTAQDDPAFAREAREAGASACIPKEAAGDELLAAIRLAAAGGTRAEPPDDLSERELDVLRLIALGHTNAEIGARLYLSTRTVETHRAHLQRKLRRRSRAALVRYALEHGLVPVPAP